MEKRRKKPTTALSSQIALNFQICRMHLHVKRETRGKKIGFENKSNAHLRARREVERLTALELLHFRQLEYIECQHGFSFQLHTRCDKTTDSKFVVVSNKTQ